ncbi:MAG TPA: hypothetical protein VF077_08910 [Nitrospiraceae bacterium]
MPVLKLTQEAYNAIKQEARLPFKQGGSRLIGGMWHVPISQDVMHAISDAQLAGESLSDTIIRMINRYHARIH